MTSPDFRVIVLNIANINFAYLVAQGVFVKETATRLLRLFEDTLEQNL